MRDYTLVVYSNPELTKSEEYVHVDVHGVKEGCLHIHMMNKEYPYIIPLHAFYMATVLEK